MQKALSRLSSFSLRKTISMWYTDNGLPYLNQIARVTIGNLQFNVVNSIDIDESVTEISDTAIITLPRFFEKLDGKYPLDYMRAGDKVTIEYGYVETGLNVEFEGYLKTISSDAPLELTCDQLYPLRQNNLVKSYRSVTLKQLLLDATKGSFIKRIECPDVQMGKWLLDNSSTYEVLQKVKEQYGFFTRTYGDLLHVGFAWDWRPGFTKNHILNMQGNVKANDLVYKSHDQFNVRVRVKIRHKKGAAAYVESGSKDKDATVYTIDYAADSEKVAKNIADARLKKAVYDGYSGSITSFGIPLTHAGDSATIQNERELYREGTYLIEKVKKTYNSSGISRVNTIAFKI
jgi:hypothetical protein